MSEIKCPKCGEVFKVDEQGYSAILEQVRSAEFSRELNERVAEERQNVQKVAELQFAGRLTEKDREIDKLKAEANAKLAADKESLNARIAEQERQIAELKAMLKNGDTARALAVKESEDKLRADFTAEREALSRNISDKDARIVQLEAQMKGKDTEKELEVQKAVSAIEAERGKEIASLTAELKGKDEVIEYYKDLKSKLSTKMVGETLEQHCLTEFDRLRATAFRNAYFEKDNDASSGSKGDFIFRECDEEGNEVISIMFEMKNEQDTTSTKKKNEHFFKELDKDRREKHCEYAILVTLLEPDSELYNTGIVDVSYRYEKMYVIRPQFFIPMISLLRNAAMNSMAYKAELARVKNENMDLELFEQNVEAFKAGFAKNYVDASKRFEDAVKAIDNAIKNLEKVKENLTISNKHLTAANNKLDDLSVKKLTKNSPAIAEKFRELHEDK